MSQTKAQLIDNLVQALNFTGTASAPANGAFLSATNTLALATNSAQRLTIDSTGDVGIGTSSPTFSTFGSNTGGIEISDVGSGANALLVQSSSNEFFFANTSSANYIYGADNAPLIISTNGSERMRIKSDGTVGIGTTSPDTLLHLSGADTAVIRLENSDNSLIADQIIGGLEFEKTDPSGAGAGVVGGLRMYSSDVIGSATYLTLSTSDSSTNNVERMRIDSSGRVIIGATSVSPANSYSNNLVVSEASGDAGISIHGNNSNSNYASIYLSDAGAASRAYLEAQLGSGTSTNFTIGAQGITRFLNNGAERMRIDSSGRVIVGSSSHIGGAQFVVMGGTLNTYGAVAIGNKATNPTASTSIAQFRFNSGATGTRRGASIAVETDGNWTDGSSHPSRMLFSTTDTNATGATERMRIHSNGSISIGVNQNNGIFCVSEPTSTHAQAVRFKASTSSGLSNTTAALIDIHGFYSNNYNAFGITFLNGDDGAGSARTAKAIQFVNQGGSEVGSIQQNQNSTSFNTSSDYRLKENATAISDGITRLKTLKPYRFNFKGQTQVVDGFFAHEVTAVPEAITGVKDEMQPETRYEEGDTIPSGKAVGDAKTYSSTEMKLQSIDQSKLVPLLTAALQEEISKREALEARVAALEAA